MGIEWPNVAELYMEAQLRLGHTLWPINSLCLRCRRSNDLRRIWGSEILAGSPPIYWVKRELEKEKHPHETTPPGGAITHCGESLWSQRTINTIQSRIAWMQSERFWLITTLTQSRATAAGFDAVTSPYKNRIFYCLKDDRNSAIPSRVSLMDMRVRWFWVGRCGWARAVEKKAYIWPNHNLCNC